MYCILSVFMIVGVWCIPHHTADHSNHCHAEDGDSKTVHIEVGESASLPGKCQKVTCEKDFSISAITCPAYVSKPGCKQSEIDYKKPYPDCCPHDVCKN